MGNKIYQADLLDIALYNEFEKLKINDQLDAMFDDEILIEISSKHNINIEFLFERYKWLKSMDIDPNTIHLCENHELIYNIFNECNKMFNEIGIEYYYTSGILAYLLVNKKLERYHHDLDVFVNMKDLEQLEKQCTKYGFKFERKLGDRSDGTKRIMLKLYYKEFYDIPITIFMYIKELDMSITQKDYFINNDGYAFVENMYNSSKIAELSFSSKPNYFENIEYYSITLEALYLCKSENRPKDIYDCAVFKDCIDLNKLNLLQDAFKSNKVNDIENAEQDKYYDFIFKTEINAKMLVRKI